MYSRDELRRKAEKPKAKSWSDEDPFSEQALAMCFVDRIKSTLRYVDKKGWMVWYRPRWSTAPSFLAFELARQCCAQVAKLCGNGKPPVSVLTAKTAAAVERLAKGNGAIAVEIEQLDADDWVITAGDRRGDATFDLRTAIGRPTDPRDLITKTAACAVAPSGTPHPIWTAFLERFAPDPELRAFLKRFCGYCLTGVTSEHKFVFVYGTGANGKSTFMNTVAGIFGEYATIADVGTFMAAAHERHPTDIAKLHGYRLVIAQETEKGRRWDETKIKSMTGGDKMTARFMRQDFFDFTPKFKLWVIGNHKPRLDNVDEAMRRRLLLVPFLVQIPPEERDPELAQKLKAEWPAILRWMLEGCVEWQAVGLAPPKIVTEATDQYFDDQDTIQQWLEDCTEDGGPHAFTPHNQLFASWKSWCEEKNLRPGSGQALTDALVDRGFTRKRGHGGIRGFRSLVLRGNGP
jgi:putative DNA primase/helicase